MSGLLSDLTHCCARFFPSVVTETCILNHPPNQEILRGLVLLLFYGGGLSKDLRFVLRRHPKQRIRQLKTRLNKTRRAGGDGIGTGSSIEHGDRVKVTESDEGG